MVDTGAFHHVTPRRDFSTYKSGNLGVVKMGNVCTSKIVGIGDIEIETNLSCKLVLQDVRHVLHLRLNLISAEKLDEEGHINTFRKGNGNLPRDPSS